MRSTVNASVISERFQKYRIIFIRIQNEYLDMIKTFKMKHNESIFGENNRKNTNQKEIKKYL